MEVLECYYASQLRDLAGTCSNYEWEQVCNDYEVPGSSLEETCYQSRRFRGIIVVSMDIMTQPWLEESSVAERDDA